ncbi:MAG TPA: hypothetical protein VMP68_29445 [Candidatus Eisenbacteria bacterium]|nr:hypothetical protein [Candidatus Eisenbacteria bacterium]
MFPMRQLIAIVLLFGGVLRLSAQQTTVSKPASITVKASILQEKYCRADADVFTVSLKLKLEVTNSSESTVQLLWPLVPWVGKVASSMDAAESGRFLYEQTASHYPQETIHFDRLKIESGKTVTLQSGYDLVARHDPAFSLPQSVSAGSYGLILVLKPEEEPPAQLQGSETLQSITTDPFLVRVPSRPKLAVCEAEGETR